MRCTKHNKIFCFSRHCRGELRWTGWPAPRVPVPPPAAPQAGRSADLAEAVGDDQTLGVPVVPVYREPVWPLHQAVHDGPLYSDTTGGGNPDSGPSSSPPSSCD